MIRSFSYKETKKLFNRQSSRKFPASIHKVALRKLLMLEAAVSINDLRVPPANRLEKLKGNRNGQHSIRINKQWRVCFTWKQAHAYQVEIIDYHD